MAGPDDARTVRAGYTIPAGELTWRFSRSSGPGGQSVNTTDSRASVSYDVAGSPTLPEQMRRRALQRLAHRLVDGVLTVHSERERSQHQNRAAARRRLVQQLREATRPAPAPRRPTKPTAAARERRLSSKQRRAQVKRQRRPPSADD